MKLRALILSLLLAPCSLLVGQQTTAVQKGGAAGTNNITADLNIGTGRTLTIASGGTLNIAAGATATIADGSIAWADVSKTGSSLADLTTRSATDLTSGTLTNAVLSDAAGTGTDFAIVVIPDPQNLTESDVTAAYYNAQVQWAVDNKVSENVKAVVTVGDLMNGAPNSTRLARAVAGMNLAKNASIPVVPIIGNHDYDGDSVSSRATTVFDGGFGPSYFSGQSYYGASSYPEGSNANYYISWTVGSQTYLVLALEVFPRPASISWAQGIIAANPAAYIIITTHCFLKHQGTRVLDADQYGLTAMGLPGTDYNGDELHAALVEPYSNVKMVLCGHFIGGRLHAHASEVSSTTGAVSHQLFVNYQDEAAATQCMMILRFKPSSGRINVQLWNATSAAADANYPAYDLPYHPVPVDKSIAATADILAGRDVRVGRRATIGSGELPNRVHADETGNLFVGADDRTGMSGGGQLRVARGIFADDLTASSVPYVNASKKLTSLTLSGLTLSNGTLAVAGSSNSPSPTRDTLHFDGVSGTRAQWGLSTYGAGLGAANGRITVLQRALMPAAAATRNLWAISQAADASGYGGNALNFYLHSGDKLRVELTDAAASNRKYLATDLAVISRFASTLLATAVTHDGSTTAPILYLNGIAEAMTAAGTGTQPAWNAGFKDNFLTLGTQQGGYRWVGQAEPPLLLNTVLTAAEILVWAQTSRLPDWAEVGTGSMVAQTSGTLNVGWRYRITSFATGDSFTNVGAASNATDVEFTATGTTPTTWTNASSLIPLGPLFKPVVQPIRLVADTGAAALAGVLLGGVTPITLRRDWVIQAKTNTNGNQALVNSSAVPFLAANQHRIDAWTVNNAGTSKTISLGSTSGGAQYLSGGTAAAGPNAIVLITPFNQGTALFCASNGTDVLTHTIRGHKVD